MVAELVGADVVRAGLQRLVNEDVPAAIGRALTNKAALNAFRSMARQVVQNVIYLAIPEHPDVYKRTKAILNNVVAEQGVVFMAPNGRSGLSAGGFFEVALDIDFNAATEALGKKHQGGDIPYAYFFLEDGPRPSYLAGTDMPVRDYRDVWEYEAEILLAQRLKAEVGRVWA